MNAPAAPRIAVVLPRNMHFGPLGATSIDLCARDFTLHSRYRGSTTLVGDAVDDPFPDVAFHGVPRWTLAGQHVHALRLGRAVRRLAPDLVVVHQHLSTAATLARGMPAIPFVFHTHAIPRPPGTRLRRRQRERALDAMRAIVVVSDAANEAFARAFPRHAGRATRVYNGLDFTGWSPSPAPREPVLLFVGRAHPVKGALEAGEAAAAVLARHPDWRAVFLLGAGGDNDATRAALTRIAARVGPRFALLWGAPFANVKAWCERAAIAMTPSRAEPFGRTALEAHAGGAALVSSGRDGLAEVSGEAASLVREITPAAIAAALERLIEHPEERAALGAAGAARVRALFDIRSASAKLDSLYDRLLAAPGAPS